MVRTAKFDQMETFAAETFPFLAISYLNPRDTSISSKIEVSGG